MQGHGGFNAPRGGRIHTGVDYVCEPGQPVYSPVHGRVTKHGIPYADDHTYRYIEITDGGGKRHRLFYVQPLVPVNDLVNEGQIIAEAQDISKRYPDAERPMTSHIHYEIMDRQDQFLNPEEM